MEFFIYLKTVFLILTLFICGFIITRRVCADNRIQILIPISIITGIAIFIFLLNLVAHFIKGPLGFYTALGIEILLVSLLKIKIKPKEIIFPQKGERVVWIITLLFWFIFLALICATGSATSPDWLHHSYFTSLLTRGDFPVHSPFQPDRLSSYHIGFAEILGLFKVFTGGSFAFLESTLALIALFSASQILQWTLRIKGGALNFILLIFVPLVGLVSLGNFMIVWPYQFSFPQISDGIINWFHNLPTLYDTYIPYGAPASLDSLNLFLHRMLALAIFSSIIPFILFPNESKKIFSSAIILVLLASLVLADESVFIVTAPAVVLILFFSLFKKNIKKWILFCLAAVFITVFQGGIVNEVIFKSDKSVAKVLLFPEDEKGSTAKFTNYRSYRLEAQKSKIIPDKVEYVPFRWFHFGAVWQVGFLLIACLIFTIYFRKKLSDKSYLYLTWLFYLSGITALVAFHGIVPVGWTHLNGNRFLSLSYQLSGLGIIIFIILSCINLKGKGGLLIQILLAWFVITSTLPALVLLFPRQQNLNWFREVSYDPKKPEQTWIKENLKVDTRILPFMETFPTSGPILEFVTNIGIFTPVWYDEPEAQGFDVSPPYLDLFFTQNPEILQRLKVDYIMTNKLYRSTLPTKRLADLDNTEYFKTVYSDINGDIIISKVLPEYFTKGENYKGTFYELSQILPSRGAFFIEQSPRISEAVWRVAFLTLQMQNYEMYYNSKFLPIYNFIINVDIQYNGEANDKYDYLVLGPDTDPKSVCGCQIKLVWSQIAGYVNLWKVD